MLRGLFKSLVLRFNADLDDEGINIFIRIVYQPMVTASWI